MFKTVFGFWRRSLSIRLLLLFILTCLLLVILLISSARHGFHSQWQLTIKPHLVQYLAYLTDDIGSPPDTERALELAKVLPVNIYIEGPDTHFSTNNTPLDVSDLSFKERRYKHHRSKRQEALRETGFEIGEHGDRTVLRHRSGQYSVYFELLHLRPGPHNDGGSLLALIALLATLFGCYLILRKMLKPVADISDGVKRMGAGELSYRIPVRSNNDLGTLVGSINTMATDIEKMLDAKRQLLLGASHELRSPLTRARVATEMLPESNNKQRLTDDLREMEKLIGDLLESEKMNQGHAVLSKSPTNLHQLVEEVCSDLGASQVLNQIEPSMADVLVDRTRILLLLRNLIGNALTHGIPANSGSDSAAMPDKTGAYKTGVDKSDSDKSGVESNSSDIFDSSTCRVAATIDRGPTANILTLAVTDNGPGIDPAHIDQLTEPFYRTDESRTRSTGGFGLGLYLCKLIAEAHGGSIHIDSATGKGTTVAARIPVNFSADT